MIHARPRALVLAVLATLLGGGCDNEDADPFAPITAMDTTAVLDSVAPALATVTYTGLPYGPFGLWKIASLNWGPKPFTGSHNYITADGIVQQISNARAIGQRLVLAMAGGSSTQYTTNGQFDMTKWKNKMNTYKTTAIKNAVANGVYDGTIIGDMLIDEPETKQWGNVLTKPMIDQMATYVKNIFPMLPVGVNHGPPAYQWRTWERYKVVDYATYQYVHYVTLGDVWAWRDAVLARARADGVTPAFSLNILNGGVKDRDGTWDCTGPGQAGLGTRFPNCRMTPDQVRNWGKALGPYGCFMTMWRYDGTYMSKAVNVDAFKYLATLLASKPRRSCKRP